MENFDRSLPSCGRLSVAAGRRDDGEQNRNGMGLQYGHGILGEGKGEGGVGNTRTVGNLANVEVVTYQQGFLHGRGRDL